MKEETKWFAFAGSRLLLVRRGNEWLVPTGDMPFMGMADGHVHDIPLNNGTRVKALQLPDDYRPAADEELTDLRASYNLIGVDDYLAAGKSWQILYWDNHSRFCPSCGSETHQELPIMKKCPVCGYEIYPPIATAIIVLIRRGDEILLVHARNFRGTFYGLVAGFLEPGETLEECVQREVREETGLEIQDIRYFASQPWPYPCGLMVGFTADYKSGSIRLQEDELSAGAFYSLDHLPEIPGKMSIARRLIDHWIAEQRAQQSDR